MEHITLYRKWRPQSFDEVIGQPHVTTTLANAISSGRLVHAYLFCGPRGTGKTSTARILAKAINCEEGPTSNPCNACEACKSISDGTALDVIEIDAASNRKIDEIRDLLEKIPYAPTSLRTKVYIIDEVHQLTPEASSALLKTLEEPPGHVIFVLATTEPHKILPTIISRCQRFDFSLVPTTDIAGLLARISAREEISIDPEAVSIIAEHAHGSVRDAIGVMDQISNLSGGEVSQQQVAGLLGEVESDLVFQIVDLLVERDPPGALVLVDKVIEGGKDPRRFVESIISHLRSIFLIQNAANPREIVEATDEHYRRLFEQANRMQRYEVIRLIERFGDTYRGMRWSEHPRLVLECAVVKATRLDVDVSLEGIMFRLDEIERRIDTGVSPIARGKGGSAEQGSGVPEMGGVKGGGTEEPRGTVAAGKKKNVASGARRTEMASATGGKGTGGEKGAPPERGTAHVDEVQAGGPAAVRSGGSIEKSKRAWMAVLAELKKRGDMRLYALLMKARIIEGRAGEVVLGFPGDASFQLEVLQESGELREVESVFSGFLGDEVSLRTVSVGGGKTAGQPVEQGVSPAVEVDGEGGEEEEEEGGNAAEKESGKDIAERIKKHFDGEIVEGGS